MSIKLDSPTFHFLLQETVIELFFSSWYKEVSTKTEFCIDVPVYFYRKNSRKDILISTQSGCINSNYELSTDQKDAVIDISKIWNDLEHLRWWLLKILPDWSLFISSKSNEKNTLLWVRSFEGFEPSKAIELFFIKYGDNLYIKEWRLLMAYKTASYSFTENLFQEIISEDPGNPFILLRYARFLWSVRFKQTRDTTILDTAKIHIHEAIKNLWDEICIFSFAHAWMGQLYHAEGKYDNAINWYNKTIELNESHAIHTDEPYIWKANSLTALGKHKESDEIYTRLLERWLSEKHKNDYRNFQVMAINAWHQKKIQQFQKNFIKSFLLLRTSEKGEFSVTIDGARLWIETVFSHFQHNNFLKNDMNSFIKYHEKWAPNMTQDIMMPIMLFGYLFLKNELWIMHVEFHNSRHCESLCFYYLQTLLHA